MNSPLVLRSAAYRQFGEPGGPFVLVTDDSLADRFVLDPAACRPDTTVVGCAPDADLGRVVAGLPDDADVLVVRPGAFVTSPQVGSLGRRRVAVMPCGSTPMTAEHVGYFLEVLERTDPTEQAKRADAFFDAAGSADHLRLVHPGGASCRFDPHGPDYEWNQQAGPLDAGEQQIAPAGELSVLPMPITDFDTDRHLALDGTLTLRGWSIVHGGYDPALAGPQAELFERLLPLRRQAIELTVADGVVTDCRSASAGGQSVVEALTELFAEDPRYRTIWELGFGINTAMDVQPANCGCNEVFGGTAGVVHIGLGLTPFTRFALTFLCPETTVLDDTDTVLLGTEPPARRDTGGAPRIRRIRSASCGCL